MKVFIHTLGLLLLLSCGNNGADTSQSETEANASVTALDRDTLRSLYQQYYAALEDSLPLQQIREEGKLYPVDEAPRDTAFFVFREQLKATLAQRDVFGLLDVVDKNIKVSFGGEEGVADFVTTWDLDSKAPDSLRIWKLLSHVLAQGGTFSKGGKAFYAPYVHSTWPDAYDSYTYGVVAGSGVRMREGQSLNSRILKTVSYDIIKVLEEGKAAEIGGEVYPWIKVEHLDGTQGYIYGKFVGQPIGYRAGFEKGEKGWRMVFFVAGD